MTVRNDRNTSQNQAVTKSLKPNSVTDYEFQVFYHPYVCEAIRRLNRYGIDGLLHWPTEAQPNDPKQPIVLESDFSFDGTYQPRKTGTGVVMQPYPIETLDFSSEGSTAYSQYNWELFFHAPLLIATKLSSNQQFAEAQKWFHYIFDPTDRSRYKSPAKFWKMRKFYDDAVNTAPETLQHLMEENAQELNKEVSKWRDNPFNPHLIARMRTIAYQKTVVMKYIDNVIAWGDHLFRQETIEAINEATQLYILAADILGPRPQTVPSPAQAPSTLTYNQLRDKLDKFSNELENVVPDPNTEQLSSSGLEIMLNINQQMPFFCIPINENLLGYWDTVADRLFKIRNCMNIEGVVRQLPLFEPPINPALLVQAAAAGLDINSVLSEVNAALPNYRFGTLMQKATELCADVRTLGAALLAALEKGDAETLAQLRSQHELDLLNAVRDVKSKQVDEAAAALEGLMKYRDVVDTRYNYYTSRLRISAFEQAHLDRMLESMASQSGQAMMELEAMEFHLFPDFKIGAPPTDGSTYGGSNIAGGIQAFGGFLGTQAAMSNTQGAMSATQAGYDRRWDDWQHQANLAGGMDGKGGERAQADKQILAAQIRLDIANTDLANHDKQIEQSGETDAYLHDKFTNAELYDWMAKQISAVYFQSYQMAFDVAKRAERAYQFERADFGASFIQFGYWDSLKQGLHAGERLHYDLKRMEVAYLDRNKREYEITKHISLAMLDPIALMMLKETGQCFVSLPEWLFDMDYPGHYMRRIKSVSLTIPCVAGPYTSVNCTLTLLWNSVRISSVSSDPYRRKKPDDKRFRDNVGAIQSIVTSSGQNDSGVFELNFRDERYLPFEGAGVISDWRIELPKDNNAFDFNSISDGIFYLRYTAWNGGENLKHDARTALQLLLIPPAVARKEPPDEITPPRPRLLSAKHEFPDEWYQFLHPTDPATPSQTLQLNLTKERFPFQFQGQKLSANDVKLFLKLKDNIVYNDSTPLIINKVGLQVSGSLVSQLPSTAKSLGFSDVPGTWTLEVLESDLASLDPPGDKSWWQIVTVNGVHHTRLKPEAVEDIWLLIAYTVQ